MKFCDVCINVQIKPNINSSPKVLARIFNTDMLVLGFVFASLSSSISGLSFVEALQITGFNSFKIALSVLQLLRILKKHKKEKMIGEWHILNSL